jgi:pyruvate/2-oxoglutarate dehydrogenase complex dihydrolipoamide acyltransferase (E2) component
MSDLFRATLLFARIANRITYQHQTGGTVGVSEILVQIDHEIAQLQRARTLLASSFGAKSKKVAAAPTAKKATKKRKKKRHLSPEGRKRIAEAVKRRWAEQKKAAPVK